jgi:hypothetical protein
MKNLEIQNEFATGCESETNINKKRLSMIFISNYMIKDFQSSFAKKKRKEKKG